MQVTVERPQPCEAVMTIEPDDEQLEQAKDRAYREYAKYVNVPGFRPGKAPRPLLEQMLDAETVEKRAREIVIPIAYKAAIDQEKLEPWDQGTVDEVNDGEDKPFSFKATVPLKPEVELGDYSHLTARRQAVAVADEDVQREIDRILMGRARLEPTADPAKEDDVVFADMDTTVGGEPVGETRTATFQIGQNMPEIDAALTGATGGDTRETDVEYPADYPDQRFAGNTVHFTFRVNHVLTRRVPELTDQWVAENTDVPDVATLKARIRENLEAAAKQAAEDDVRSQLINEISDRSQVYFPGQLVDREVAQELKSLSASLEERGSNLERYLQQINHTLPQLQDEIAASASRRIKNGLVMGKIAQVENLQLTRDEINAEINRIAQENDVKPSDARRRLRDEGQMDRLEERLLQDKLFNFLKDRADIQEEPAAAGASEASAE